MTIQNLRHATGPAAFSDPAESPPRPSPAPIGCFGRLFSRRSPSAAHPMPPRQQLPKPPEPPSPFPFDDLPEVLQTKVMECVGGFYFDTSQRFIEPAASRSLAASRFSEVNSISRKVASNLLNQRPEECYLTTYRRLRHAAKQDNSGYTDMAAAVKDLGYVRLDFSEIPSERREDAIRVLMEHPDLRGLSVSDSDYDRSPSLLTSGKLVDISSCQ